MFSYLEYSKKNFRIFFQDPIILVRECSLSLPLWDLWTPVFRMFHNPVQRTTSGIHLEWPFRGFITSSHKYSILAVFTHSFANLQLSLPIDKGYHPNYKERICVHIWRLRKEVTEIKGAEVASSHVGLVSLRTLPDKYSGTGDLVITSFGTNATGFLIGLIAHAKQMLCKTTVMIG